MNVTAENVTAMTFDDMFNATFCHENATRCDENVTTTFDDLINNATGSSISATISRSKDQLITDVIYSHMTVKQVSVL